MNSALRAVRPVPILNTCSDTAVTAALWARAGSGAPVLLKDLLAGLLDELHEVCVTRGGLPSSLLRCPSEPRAEVEAASASLSRAA